jgi:hypothetical protein
MTPSRFAYALLLVCSNGTACELPALAAIPEKIGDDVTSVLRDVRRYSDGMVEYTDCLKAELAAGGGSEAPVLLRSVLALRNNNAVAEHKALTALYAERVGPLENLRLAEYVAADSKDCLLGSSLVKTGVVNDGAVIFFARNKQAYLNVLPATCAGLERDGQFYVGNQPATSGGLDTPLSKRVCDQDDIFPYREDSGRRVISCGLGRFFPISEEQALQILTLRGDPAAAPSEADARGVP